MARTEANLTTFTLASDYDPAHYNWTKNELAALGDYKATAEVIKKRLEDNGKKVEEVYAVEHKGEAKTDSESKEHHKGTDETKPHYHILVKFVEKQGATLKEIAKYIGVRQEIIEKLKPGGYSYYNMLAYLIHIKYENKIQCKPEDVATLAGTDYTAHYNEYKESWENARPIVAKKGGKALKSHYHEAVRKLKNGEITYAEIAKAEKYREVFLTTAWRRELKKVSEGVREIASEYCGELTEKIKNEEITSIDAIISNKNYALAYKYHAQEIDSFLEQYTRCRG